MTNKSGLTRKDPKISEASMRVKMPFEKMERSTTKHHEQNQQNVKTNRWLCHQIDTNKKKWTLNIP